MSLFPATKDDAANSLPGLSNQKARQGTPGGDGAACRVTTDELHSVLTFRIPTLVSGRLGIALRISALPALAKGRGSRSKAAYFFIQEAGRQINDGAKILTVVTSLLAAYTGFYSTYAGAKSPVEPNRKDFVMPTPIETVTAFCAEFSIDHGRSAIRKWFTPDTVWVNEGLSVTTGIDEAIALIEVVEKAVG
ncbi:MAG TPA: limonene-1,2-epoxide hydrolase family protein, partial [Candidatus Methylacidiphilales bacterium]|nr:limonene-1,2-epoxide hydrolase family protein [Candidatus Methylacidiphilales bacterium]